MTGKKMLLSGVCVLWVLCGLTACRSAQTAETETEKETIETETADTEETETTETSLPETEMRETEISLTETEAAATETKAPQTETSVSVQPSDDTQEAQEDVIPETTQAASGEEAGQQVQENVIPETAQAASGEAYLQCPYCLGWFSAQTDDGASSPYDRHLLEEQSGQGEQTSEQEMAQCPDCGNWYEVGNIFRNHICSGRQN